MSQSPPLPDIEIRPKRDSDTWEDITALLHEAYREHLLASRRYQACTQTPERTAERCEGGVCLLAWAGGRLAGTATVVEGRNRGRPCGNVAQVAVAPSFRHLGLGARLLAEIERLARGKGWDRLVCDTAVGATELVAWYLRQGWQKVSCASYPGTNYYSIVFRKKLDGKPRPPVAWTYPLGVLFCHALWRPDGTLRPLGRLARRLSRF